jgi:hypothetical protein
VLVAGALLGGWWLGQHLAAPPAGDPKRDVLSKEAAELQQRLERSEADAADQQRLLELLVGLDRKDEAIALLEPMADREPDRWSLRLLLAELRRDRNDRAGAERELRLILNRQPDQPEALQLMTLLKLEQGKGQEAEAQVRAAYEAASKPEVKPQALPLGLLLAELQQKRQQNGQAIATYRRLAAEFPSDQRPLLGLALLQHDSGNLRGAQESLAQARSRSPQPGKPDAVLDRLAASWGLAPLRDPASSGSPPKQESPEPTESAEPPAP